MHTATVSGFTKRPQSENTLRLRFPVGRNLLVSCQDAIRKNKPVLVCSLKMIQKRSSSSIFMISLKKAISSTQDGSYSSPSIFAPQNGHLSYGASVLASHAEHSYSSLHNACVRRIHSGSLRCRHGFSRLGRPVLSRLGHSASRQYPFRKKSWSDSGGAVKLYRQDAALSALNTVLL